MKLGLPFAACLALLAGGANAATIDALAGPASTASAAATTISGAAGQYTDSVSGLRLSPWFLSAQDNSAYYSIWYGGAITFTFDALQNALSLAWGTPDSYNYVSFYNGSALIETISGASVPVNAADSLAFGELVKVTPLAGFDTVVFESYGTAFEFGAVQGFAAPVPVPAAGLMLGAALAGTAALRRRKRAA